VAVAQKKQLYAEPFREPDRGIDSDCMIRLGIGDPVLEDEVIPFDDQPVGPPAEDAGIEPLAKQEPGGIVLNHEEVVEGVIGREVLIAVPVRELMGQIVLPTRPSPLSSRLCRELPGFRMAAVLARAAKRAAGPSRPRRKETQYAPFHHDA
jgi:hypothetical protein